jgi:TRAP-type C4-dicarboxylate transport system permease small subunit
MKKDLVTRIDSVVRLFAIGCGYASLGLCFLIGFEIVARKLFGFSVQGVDEIGGYVLAITASIGFAYALVHRVHTRIELGLALMSPTLQAVLNALAAVVIAAFASFMALRAFGALSESIEFGSRASTPLQTPLWIPQAIWFAGICVFAFVGIVIAAHALLLLARDRDLLNQTYGPPSLDEEIKEQLAEAERHLDSTAKG